VERRLYSGWADALILVKPEMVVSWHRAGFRLFWPWRSRQPGRPKVTRNTGTDPAYENREAKVGCAAHPWRIVAARVRCFGAHGLALPAKLKARRYEGKGKRWQVLLNHHREVIAAFDFFMVPMWSANIGPGRSAPQFQSLRPIELSDALIRYGDVTSARYTRSGPA
jgi:hypothetical protein